MKNFFEINRALVAKKKLFLSALVAKKKLFLLATAVLMAVSVTAGEKQVYTVFKYSTNRLIYYYDDQMANRVADFKELYIPQNDRFAEYAAYVERIEIDESMKDAPLTSMKYMFTGWSHHLINVAWIDDIENLNTAAVTDMEGVFCGLSSLLGIDLSHFNTSKVNNMHNMFAKCSSLTELDLRYFDMSHVIKASYMFADCTNLESIYCRDRWNISTSTNMFQYCTSLHGDKGTQYNSIYAKDCTLARPDGGSASPGYFSAPPCLEPHEFEATNITSTSMTLSWVAGGDEKEWRISYNIKGAPDSQEIDVFVSSSPYTLNALLPNTTYYILIKGKCGDEYSYTSNWLEATTKSGSCGTPTDLAASEVKSNTATLQWKAPAGQSKWQVKVYKNSQSGVPTIYNVQTKYINLQNLEPETKYLVQVRAVCGESDYSAYTSVVRFTTPSTQGIDEVMEKDVDRRKYIIDGNLVIKVGDKLFDAQGKELR